MKDKKQKRVTDFARMKKDGIPITALTGYDAAMARILDRAGIDLILVGDSLGNVVQGKATTLSVTLEQMIYHGEIVARTAESAFVAVDMPFMSYQTSPFDAIANAGKIMKETGAHAVKLEGGIVMADTIRRIVDIGIPVLGHVGLIPQSVHALGGFNVQGRDNEERIMTDAAAVEESGAFAVVLEKMPATLAEKITKQLTIPTIGIGAGPECDGQILVINDILNMDSSFQPAFVKIYAELEKVITEAVKGYISDVKSRYFPSEKESYS